MENRTFEIYENYLYKREILENGNINIRRQDEKYVQQVECIKRIDVFERLDTLKRVLDTENFDKLEVLTVFCASLLQEMLMLTKCEKTIGEKNQIKSKKEFYAAYDSLYNKTQYFLNKLKNCMTNKETVRRIINRIIDEIYPLWCNVREYIISIDTTQFMNKEE